MARFHIFSQYIWPDGGPDGLYAEQLAVRLHEAGHEVRLIGGKGTYRRSGRSKPGVPLLYLDHYCGRRKSLAETFIQYCAVAQALRRYIGTSVKEGDTVVVTSAPPSTVHLAKSIKRRGARAIYWLQDYYPELIRGIYDYPDYLRSAFCAHWDRQLLQWDRVVKIGGNLRGPSRNSLVIRNWPTLEFGESVEPEPRTALYSGNIGYGHDIDLFVVACGRLRDEGYEISIHADGFGVSRLPAWLEVKPLHPNPEELKRDLLRNEVHLVAAHPRIRQAIFPSKIWNSIASGRQLICTGFEGEMTTELELARTACFEEHLEEWTRLLLPTDKVSQDTLAVAA